MKRDRGRLGRVQAGERPTSGRKRKARLQGGSARHCRGLWATGIPRVQGPTMQTRGVRPQPSTEGRRCNAAGKYSNISRKAHRKPEELGATRHEGHRTSPPEREPHPHGYRSRRGAFFPRAVAHRRRAFRAQVPAPRRAPSAGAASYPPAPHPICSASHPLTCFGMPPPSRANADLSGSSTRPGQHAFRK